MKDFVSKQAQLSVLSHDLLQSHQFQDILVLYTLYAVTLQLEVYSKATYILAATP